MSRLRSRPMRAALSGLGLVVLSATTAPAAERCTGFTALSANTADELCACTTVTHGFIRAIQGKYRFPELLAATEEQCPALANILSDLPTAAPGTPTTGPGDDDADDDGEDDPEEEEEVDDNPYDDPDYQEGGDYVGDPRFSN